MAEIVSAPSTNAPFRLTSLNNGPVYIYELESGDAGSKTAVYRRQDGQRLQWNDDFGWSGRDERSQELSTIVWGVPASQQGDTPPEGQWISKKGVNSFVYDGRFGISAADKKAQAQRYREAIGGVEM